MITSRNRIGIKIGAGVGAVAVVGFGLDFNRRVEQVVVVGGAKWNAKWIVSSASGRSSAVVMKGLSFNKAGSTGQKRRNGAGESFEGWAEWVVAVGLVYRGSLGSCEETRMRLDWISTVRVGRVVVGGLEIRKRRRNRFREIVELFSTK